MLISIWHIFHIVYTEDIHKIYVHTYTYIITIVLRGTGRTQNVSYIFQGVFEGGLEHVSLHFEGMLKTLPTETTPGGRSVANFTFKGGPRKMYLTLWYGSPLKSSLKGVVIIYRHLHTHLHFPDTPVSWVPPSPCRPVGAPRHDQGYWGAGRRAWAWRWTLMSSSSWRILGVSRKRGERPITYASLRRKKMKRRSWRGSSFHTEEGMQQLQDHCWGKGPGCTCQREQWIPQ